MVLDGLSVLVFAIFCLTLVMIAPGDKNAPKTLLQAIAELFKHMK